VSPSWGLPFNLQMNGPQNVLLKYRNRRTERAVSAGSYRRNERRLFRHHRAEFRIRRSKHEDDRCTEVDDGFILNGSKTWISGVPYCGCGVVYAMTDKAAKAQRHVSIFSWISTPRASSREQSPRSSAFTAHRPVKYFSKKQRFPKSALVG
jgi:hypothetical protein